MKDGKRKYGGLFKDELDAAKRVKKLYEELNTPLRNPAISTMSYQQYETKNTQYEMKEKTSKYKGVTWHRESGKWYVQIYQKGQNPKYGGHFNDELEAAKRANQLCEELGIPPQNPTISAIPNQQYQKKEKISQYKGVCWQKERKIWRVRLHVKGEKEKFGGNFKDEVDAAKRVNQLCEELGIPPQNPGVVEMPTQHDDFQTIENSVISSEISKTDNDDANKKKRKRKKEFNDDKFPDERHYFYDDMLK
jgi:hypothetical protein